MKTKDLAFTVSWVNRSLADWDKPLTASTKKDKIIPICEECKAYIIKCRGKYEDPNSG